MWDSGQVNNAGVAGLTVTDPDAFRAAATAAQVGV